HTRIELVGLAVHVDIGAREIDRHSRKTEFAHTADQLVHEGIFGPAQRGHIDTGRLDEFGRIDRAGMWGIENDRRAPRGRLRDLKRRRQLANWLVHRWAPSLQSVAPG